MQSEAELQAFRQLAMTIGRNQHLLAPLELTGFMAMEGQRYNRELMVVGRAVNGWTKRTWTPASLASSENVQEFANSVQSINANIESCPMQWVSMAWGNCTIQRPSFWSEIDRQDYSTLDSAFWRVIRNVVGGLKLADINDQAWPSCLTWSNLYKIAPSDGGNPQGKLLSLQRKGCISLLEAELETYKPRRLLFLTGQNWAAPFLKELVPNIKPVLGANVHAFEKCNIGADEACTVVVATHPQGKRERQWVEEVLKHFQAVGCG